MDPELVAMVRAAEAGATCPTVRLFAGGQHFVGVPCPSRTFVEVSQTHLAAEYEEGLAKRPRRERKQRPLNATQLARQALEPLGAVPDHRDLVVITLRDAEWWTTTATGGLRLPVVRVALTSVDAWWIAGQTPLQGGIA